MSITLEVIPLEGIDMEASPPCEMLRYGQADKHCGAPSEWRVRSECACGRVDRLFLCGKCKILLEKELCKCLLCGSPRGIDGYL